MVDLPGIQSQEDEGWENFRPLLKHSEKVLFVIFWQALQKPEVRVIFDEVKETMVHVRGQADPRTNKATFDHLSLVVTKMDGIGGSYTKDDGCRLKEIQDVVAEIEQKQLCIRCFFTGIEDGKFAELPGWVEDCNYKQLKDNLVRAVTVVHYEQKRFNEWLRYMANYSETTIIRFFTAAAASGGITRFPGDSQLAILVGSMVLIRKHHHIYEWGVLELFQGQLAKGMLVQIATTVAATTVLGFGVLAISLIKGSSAMSSAYCTLTEVNDQLKKHRPGPGEHLSACEIVSMIER